MEFLAFMRDILFMLTSVQFLSTKFVKTTEFFVAEDVAKQYTFYNTSKHWFSYITAFVYFSLTKNRTSCPPGQLYTITRLQRYLRHKSVVLAEMVNCNGGKESWEKTTWNLAQL